jgi:acetate kinase
MIMRRTTIAAFAALSLELGACEGMNTGETAGALGGAAAAIDYFIYAIGKQLGSLTAALGGLDALVFTAGIGENSANVRRRVCESLEWLGITLDPDANESGADVISAPGTPTKVLIVRTSEETMIALHVLEALSAEAVA